MEFQKALQRLYYFLIGNNLIIFITLLIYGILTHMSEVILFGQLTTFGTTMFSIAKAHSNGKNMKLKMELAEQKKNCKCKGEEHGDKTD